MTQLSLLDKINESNEDDFSNLNFESDYIKRVNFETEEEENRIFHLKEILTTSRIPKKKTIEFRVFRISLFKENKEKIIGYQDFKKEQEARDFFEGHKQHLFFLKEKNKENKVFDGRRYFWVVDDKDNLTKKRGWD